MPRMKGADVITEYLIDSKIPYVFGICGHGNVGMLDSLYAARGRITLVSPRHEQVAAHLIVEGRRTILVDAVAGRSNSGKWGGKNRRRNFSGIMIDVLARVVPAAVSVRTAIIFSPYYIVDLVGLVTLRCLCVRSGRQADCLVWTRIYHWRGVTRR